VIAAKESNDAVSLILQHLKRPERVENEEVDDARPEVNLLEHIQSLRESEGKYQGFLKQTEAKSAELDRLKKRNPENEETQIRAHIASHQKRLRELEDGLEQLAKDRARVGELENEIQTLKRNAAALESAHAEFTKAKALLG
jgi:uncharacterized protein involved in exopolysaccharide biosynthesis